MRISMGSMAQMVSTGLARYRLTLLVVLLANLGSFGQASANCFTPQANKSLYFKVIRQVAPPRSIHQRSYRFWPLSDVATGRIDLLARLKKPRFGTYHFMWANRCEDVGNGKCKGHNPKGNILSPRPRKNGRELRPFFTSLAKADTCTLLQTRFILGAPRTRLHKGAANSGLVLVRHSRHLASWAKNGQFTDICVLPKARLARHDEGIVLDFEVQDGRSPEATKKFLSRFADLVHARGKQAILYTNPLDAPTQKYTGIDRSNAAFIYRKFDAIALLLHHRNRQGNMMASYRSQIGIIKAGLAGRPINYRKILIGFALGETTMEQAELVHHLIRDKKMLGTILWRNRARPGGDCQRPVNRKLSCLLFGKCR